MKSRKKGPMLVYTVGLTNSRREWFESCVRGVVAEARHFGSVEDFASALDGEKPGMVVVADPPVTEAEVRQILDARAELQDVPIFKIPSRTIGGEGIGPKGSAAAVLTGFDTMPPLDDSDPWVKQPI